MPKIWLNASQFNCKSKIALTIGTFDGVHVGHQKIIRRLIEHKKEGFETAILTFDPHPRKVLFPNQTDLRLITTNQEKIALLENFGLDHIIVHPFDLKFASLSSEEYVLGILKHQLKVNKLIIGYDHRFGKNRTGGINELREFGIKNDFTVEEIPAKDIDSIHVSSSLIRKAIEQRNFKVADQYLGYHFFIQGTVVEGKKLGRKLGYPTANLNLENKDKIVPPPGVYAVKIACKNKTYFGMMNIGTNPTTDLNNQIKMEVHIFDFSEDIYGENLKVEFVAYLREEKKFDTLDHLIYQLQQDESTAKKVFSQI